MSARDDLPLITFPTAAQWEAWLEAEHARSQGVWLQIAKKESGIESVTYPQALDVALCFGWIDGQKAPLDDAYWLQRFTPRRPRSRWSKVNREKVTALIAAGRMREAGLREVRLAQADGRWEAAYDRQSRAVMPDDLQQALDANERAREFFATLNAANRYAILYGVHDAKRPETRAKRIAQFVEMLAAGRKPHP